MSSSGPSVWHIIQKNIENEFLKHSKEPGGGSRAGSSSWRSRLSSRKSPRKSSREGAQDGELKIWSPRESLRGSSRWSSFFKKYIVHQEGGGEK